MLHMVLIGLCFWWRRDTLFTSRFVGDVMFSYHEASGTESSTTLCSEGVRQVAVPVGRQTTTAFGRVRQNVAPGAESANNN